MNNKKAFTVVELVIVIAIIAILAAVLIPTFASMVRSANVSADTQLIKNLNTSLRADLPDGKHPTMHDALKAAEAFGYDVDKINASAVGNEILWDQENDVFCYVKGEEVIYIPESVAASDKITSNDSHELWKIYNSKADAVPAVANQTNSIYLADNAIISDALDSENYLVVNVGVDVGNKTDISKVKFVNASGAKTVVLRMNGGELYVNDTNDDSEQLFYGYADSVEVTTGSTCFVAHGVIGTMDLKAGKAIADSGAFIGLIKAASGTVAIERNGGMFIITDSSEIHLDDVSKIADHSAEEINRATEAFAQSAADEDDGTVAIIGSKKYTSLKQAVKDAYNNKTIYLVGNVTLTENIGGYSVSDQDVVQFDEYCLRTKVVLLKDITITFSGDDVNIWFQQDGEIDPNGHSLTLIGGTNSVYIYYCSGQTASGNTLVISDSLVHIEPVNNLPMCLSYSYSNNTGSWGWSPKSFLTGTGQNAANTPGNPGNPAIPFP